MEMDEFSVEAKEKLKNYVYRLIDPRDGNTFYVGKGTGDRVFHHIKEVLKDKDENLKLNIIKDIKKTGQKVIHIIHRHNMDNYTALEVEAALIDAYAGLSNQIDGYNSDYGIMNAYEIQKLYDTKQVDFGKDRCLIIKNRQERIDKVGIYDAVRFCWKASRNVKKADYVLCVVKGIIKAVFKPSQWYEIKLGEEIPQEFQHIMRGTTTQTRWAFVGEDITKMPDIKKRYKERALPKDMMKKGMSNPVLYSWTMG
jgi:hypothetical protein